MTELVKEPLKICVYTISKNEEKFVKRWADSAKDADLCVLVDTGSTDNTIELAKECGVKVHEICITPWRFDLARNASLALLPADMDVCVCIDVDEVLEPGWREEIEKVWVKGLTTRLSYLYDWGMGYSFKYEKIHARHGYHWHHPCHEYLRLDPRCEQVLADTPKLLVRHLPDANKSRGSYMDLLALSVKEDPHCSRNAFYYARELWFYGRHEESIAECKRFLELPSATWHHERCYALRVIGKCLEAQGHFDAAEGWFHKAAAEAPLTREPWCALALLYYKQSRWPESYGAATRALSITERALVYTTDPVCWAEHPHDLAAIAAWNLGLKDCARTHAKNALAFNPTDPRLESNVKMMDNLSPTIDGEILWGS